MKKEVQEKVRKWRLLASSIMDRAGRCRNGRGIKAGKRIIESFCEFSIVKRIYRTFPYIVAICGCTLTQMTIK
jgi:hypothetical protein